MTEPVGIGLSWEMLFCKLRGIMCDVTNDTIRPTLVGNLAHGYSLFPQTGVLYGSKSLVEAATAMSRTNCVF